MNFRDFGGQSRREELVSYFARICRTQLAAALGNVIFVSLGAAVFNFLWGILTGTSYLNEELAEYVMGSLSPVSSGTVFYAALTGVILWLGSLAGGWLDNWFFYNRLGQAIADHHLGAMVGEGRLKRWAERISKNVSGWGVSICLGMMMGMTPELGRIMGLPLDVRHVTLNSGMMALAVSSLGHHQFHWNWFLLAFGGITITFVLNLSVSFYLALRLAMRAYDVSISDRMQLYKTLLHHMLRAPWKFLCPPKAEESRFGSRH
jgi:site-specific recombinase